VLNQTHHDNELIVVDNDSSDGTEGIAGRYADILLHAGPERSAQRNAGLHAAHGEYVLFIDADMVLDPDVVSSVLAQAERGARAVAIPEVSFGEGFWSRCKALERCFYADDPVVSAARFFPRALVQQLGGYDETLHAGEDWDLSMRASGDAPLAFATATIRHDEGRQTLGALFAKKYYYGKSLPRFVRKCGSRALRRLNPARGSLLCNADRLFRNPIVGAGVVVMKSAELCGILFGMVVGDQFPDS